MRTRNVIIGLVVLLMVASPVLAAGTELLGSTKTTDSDFNDGTTNGLQVTGGSVAHTHDSFSRSDINNGNWELRGDTDATTSTGSTLAFEPDGPNSEMRYVYTDQVYSGHGGEFYIRGNLEYFEYEDDSNDIDGGYVLEAENGDQWRLVMRGSHYNNPWVLRRVGPGGAVQWESSGFGGHYEFGGAIDVRFGYDDTTGTIRADIYGPDDVEASKSWSNNDIDVQWVGVTADGGPNGDNWIEASNLDLNGYERTGGTYDSAAHNVDAPTEAEVDVRLENGDMDITVHDGNGNTLGSRTISAGGINEPDSIDGTRTISLDPSQQVGDDVYIDYSTSGDSSGSRLTSYLDETRIYYENRDPSATAVSPDGGTYESSSVELEADVDDPDFGTNGDSVDVEWYVDGTKVHTDTGVTSASTLTYQTADRDDGDYDWHVEVVDSEGARTSSGTNTFTIQHGETEITNVQPADGTTSNYETNTLSADIDDPDFEENGGSGDTVTVEFVWDGSVIYSEDVTSPSTVTYDAGPFDDGTHDWYVRTTDSYGGTYTSDNRSLTIDHDAPSLSGESPTGTVEYEDQTLSVDVDDADFPRDDDTVDVTFTLDGSQVGTETLNSNGTATVDVGPLDDGSHTWSATATDDYELSSSTGDQTFTVEHHDPVLSSPAPTSTIADSTPEMSVIVDDEDFSKDGDEVLVEFYIDGSKVGEDTVTSDGTLATYETSHLEDGTYDAYMVATDEYGRTDTTSTFSFTVEHNDPELTNAQPTGEVQYEDQTLSVDLSDDDFDDEGDTVELEFILDGQVVSTQTATSAGTYTHDLTELDDGSYTWSVDATDEYERTSSTGDQTFTVDHDAPTASNPSLDGVTNYEQNTLEVDVADADFPRDGDTVDVMYYVDGTHVNTETVSTNSTASYTTDAYEDGSHSWHVRLVDDYGYDVNSTTWSMDIQHSAPVVAGTSDPGVTNRENVDLTVDVQDDDFVRDGDTINVTWYVDGSELITKEVASAGDVTATTDELTDGTHSWSVDLEDDYGYSASSSVQQVEVVHHDPVPDDSSMVPTEGTTLTNYSTTFSIDVSDEDFADPTATENVTADLYIEGDLQGTAYATENGTVNVTVVPGYGGEVTYHWEFEDKYGRTAQSQDVNITSPGSLELYNELNASQQIDTTGDVSFYFQYEDQEDLVVTRDISGGSVDMGGLPTDESFVAVARADGYYNRRVWVSSLFESDSMYLIPDDADVVQQSFQLKDYTGDFPLDETVLEVQRNINGSWKTVDGDYFGADDQLNSILRYNTRHNLILRNVETGQTRELGTLFPVAGGTVELRLFDDETQVYQAGVPNVIHEPDTNAVPPANSTAFDVSFNPRESGVTEYRVVAMVDGTEELNQTYNATENANMTLNTTGHQDVELNVTYELDGETHSSVRSWAVNEFDGGEGLVASATGFLEDLGSDTGGLVAVLISGLVVAFTAGRVGPRTSGTVAVLALGAFTLLGFITTGWLAVALTAYFTLLGARWYA